MQKVLKELFYQLKIDETQYPEEWQRILTNKGILKKGFNKWQRKRLLRILDNYSMIADNMASDGFSAGVRYGVMFMIEVFDGAEDGYIDINS